MRDQGEPGACDVRLELLARRVRSRVLPRLVVARVPRDSVLTQRRAHPHRRFHRHLPARRAIRRPHAAAASRAKFGARHACPELGRVTELFIREEQHHAAQLREFMLAHGIALKQRNWTDSIFRQIRRLAGFETAVTILVTAEMVGFVYYRALGTRDAEYLPAKPSAARCVPTRPFTLRYEAQLLRTLRGAPAAMAARVGGAGAPHAARASRRAWCIASIGPCSNSRAMTARSFVKDCRSLYRTVLARGRTARCPARRGLSRS